MLPHLDYAAFARDLDELKREILASLGPDDFHHLRRIARIGRACTAAGFATAWIAPNPVSAVLLAVGTSTRWAIVGHHVTHRGLDRLDVPREWKGDVFAKGWRRWVDWLDWIEPDAWRIEHNQLHHYHTCELLDPDLAEQNLSPLRAMKIPTFLKKAAVAGMAATWRLSYYAPSTFQIARRVERLRAARKPVTAENMASDQMFVEAFDLRTEDGRRFWKECVLPYGLVRFVAAPLAFLPLGPGASLSVLGNVAMAEVLANLHTFLIIVPNHTGEDVHRFEGPTSDRAEFYLRQILGATNYPTGNPVGDFFYGYLNYQIEHHLWPDLPPAAYERAAPKVKAICEKHGVPYLQESVWTRLRKTIDIMVGETSMQRTTLRTARDRRAVPDAEAAE